MARTIRSFKTKPARQTVGDAALAALQAVAAEHNISVERLSGSYDRDGNSLSLRFAFKVQAGDGSGIPADFAAKAARFNLPADCWGKVVNIGGEDMKITGINTRRRRYPVSLTRVRDGSGRKCDAFTIKIALQAAKAA